MTELTDARARLLAGYYNSNAKSVANPGGLAANGHQLNFPAALIDLGRTLTAAGADATALYNALPDIATAVGALAATLAARDAAIAAKNQAVEIVGVDLSAKANLNSPALTGSPTAPTPPVSDNSNRLLTTAGLKAWWATVTGAAPAALDAVYELAAAINNDPNFAATMATALAAKFDKTGGTIAGAVVVRAGAGGYVSINPGDATHTGTLEFFTAEGTRRAFIGFGAAGVISIVSENGYGWGFTARPTFNGATPWDTANLSPVDQGTNQAISGQKSFTTANQSMTSPSAFPALQVLGTGSGAYMAFNRPSAYAVYFGLDTDNQLKMGGASAGAQAYRLWTEANDGSGSGMDADLWRGRAPDTAGTANTGAIRGASGELASAAFHMPGSGVVGWPGQGGGLTMTGTTWIELVGDKSLKTGGALQAGTVRETSDMRLKRFYDLLENAGDLIDRTEVYLGEKLVGGEWIQSLYVMAQDQRQVTPWAIGEDDKPYKGGPPLLSVDYGQLGLLAIVGLQEERRRRLAVEARLARIESHLGLDGQ